MPLRCAGVDRDRHPPVRHGRRAGRHLDRLPPAVGRRLPDRPQPVEPVGPERLDRDHGDGHGADHRVAQHRPVGRLAARVPRLHDGDGPDRVDPQRRSASGSTSWYTWIVALVVGIVLGAVIGGVQGFIVAYIGVPSFIVTLGGFLVWRGLIFQLPAGPDAGPAGQRRSSSSAAAHAARSASGGAGCSAASPASAIVYSIVLGPPPPPAVRLRRSVRSASTSGSACSAASSCWLRSGSPTATRGRRSSPQVYAADHGIVEPPGGLKIPTGIAYPVVIMIGVALVMTYLAAAPPLRPLRVRHRRQPGGGRARRHQRAPHDHVHVRADGRPVRGQRGGPDGPPQRRGRRASACRTSST